jgi:vitamin B12 transporter
MRKFFLLTLSVLLSAFCSVAQDSLQTTMLREVVVSASRTEQPLIQIPRSVTVIGEAVIKNSVYQSLGDLLNAQAGLYVVGANQTPGMNQNVFMRGSSSNQVAVLIDGVRITDPSSPNAVIDLSEISLANIERIEVIRGSHSTMFGGAAIGGSSTSSQTKIRLRVFMEMFPGRVVLLEKMPGRLPGMPTFRMQWKTDCILPGRSFDRM